MNKYTLTIDWEDFGQLTCRKYHPFVAVGPATGEIERQTKIILDLLDETNTKCTFFVLALLAKYRPSIVQEILLHGHEIAMHGLNHEIMSSHSPSSSRIILEDAKKCIEDIAGVEILGYRAPFFSLIKKNLYLLNILSEMGLIYDSSICPVKMARSGINSFIKTDTLLEFPNNNKIVELPLSTYSFLGITCQVSGGGYMRVMPKFLVKKVYKDFYKKYQAGVIYMHPYEFDNIPLDMSSNFPEYDSMDKLSIYKKNLKSNIFRNSIYTKIKYLLTTYDFITSIERAKYVKENGVSKKLLGYEE